MRKNSDIGYRVPHAEVRLARCDSGHGPMRTSAILRLGGCIVVALLAVSSLARAQEDDDGYDNGREARRSTWELSTSLTFERYFEPFPRVPSARACRDRCVYDRRCTGWTYYDANFRDAGEQSYRLQRVCVMGAGLKDRKSGSRPGRTSGVVHADGQRECCAQSDGDYRPRRNEYRSPRNDD
jgi:hypothetical protein